MNDFEPTPVQRAIQLAIVWGWVRRRYQLTDDCAFPADRIAEAHEWVFSRINSGEDTEVIVDGLMDMYEQYTKDTMHES